MDKKILIVDDDTAPAGLIESLAAATKMKPTANHRVSPHSETHRRMVQSKSSHIVDDSHIPADVRAHNAAIDAKNAAKKARKNRGLS